MDKDKDLDLDKIAEIGTGMEMMCCGGLWPFVYAAGILGLAWIAVALINKR